MIPVISKSTQQTYNYAYREWYKFVGISQSDELDAEQIEKNILDWIDDHRKRGMNPETMKKKHSALVRKYGRKVANSDRVREKIARFVYDCGRPPKRANPISLDELKKLVSATKTLRNKTMLAIGWAGALRASELVVIRRSDLRLVLDGFELTIPRSKTDQRGRGKVIALPRYSIAHASICPVRLLSDYIRQQLDLFRCLDSDWPLWPITPCQFGHVLQRSAMLAELPDKYSSHSLRRGMATTAARAEVPDRTIMTHGRWVTRQCFDGYVEQGTLWSRTALDFLR